MISNATIFRVAPEWTSTPTQIEEALSRMTFSECGPTQEKSVGWIPPRGEQHGALIEAIGGHWILKLKVETRSVPAAAIKRAVQAKCEHIEETTGRKPGKKEKREIADEVRLSLLPMAFTKESATIVWFNPANKILLIDSASQGRVDEVLTALVKALDGLTLSLINTQSSPAASMAAWLSTQEHPDSFSIDRECELKSADESKSVVKYANHALDIVEVRQHISQGKMPTRLGMTWESKVSFVLTEDMKLKKIAFLDVEDNDKAADAFDANVAIFTGLMCNFIPALLEALGGEVEIGKREQA